MTRLAHSVPEACLSLRAGRTALHEANSIGDPSTDICRIIDEAGLFLTRFGAYHDGMALDRAAVKRYPEVSALFQGLGYCAGHAGFDEEAVAAHERALELEPDNQKLVSDLGWTLLQAGHVLEARKTLERAVSIDHSDRLTQQNLRFCERQGTTGQARC